MFSKSSDLKAKLNGISAKTLSLGAKQYMRGRNEQQIKLLEQYTYTSLQASRSIRLLQIEPGADTDALSCRLFETDLDQMPNYNALSYTWAMDREWSLVQFEITSTKESKQQRPIVCNGRTLMVTMNLYHALTEFRRQKMQEPLWADQICINQSNNAEKKAQLAIMVEIYRSAQCVIIWLGKSSTLRNGAIDFLEKLPVTLPVASITTPEGVADRLTFARIRESVSVLTSSLTGHWHWMQVMLFLIEKGWFSRAWTLQEILLATKFKLTMGPRVIAPETFQTAMTMSREFYRSDQLAVRSGLTTVMEELHPDWESVVDLFKEREEFQAGKRYSAEDYLKIIRRRDASLNKDKVVAGSALVRPDVTVSLDYNSTTLEFYAAYAKKLWAEVNVFGLSLVGGHTSKLEGFPSWMPDLSKLLWPQPLRYCGCPTFERPFQSHKDDFSSEGNVLNLDIVEWDTITTVGESHWSWTGYEFDNTSEGCGRMPQPPSVPQERFGLMFDHLNQLGSIYKPTGENTIDCFWQSLICGINLKTEDDLSVWRDRFFQWFAFTLTTIRGTFHEEGDKIKKAWMPNAQPKKPWLIPLIADWPQLEQRVSQFLETHDVLVDAGDVQAPSLRQVIARVMKRLLGTDDIHAADYGRGELAEILELSRKDDFYSPISLFGRHFQIIYTGRRIVTTEKGYMGSVTGGVRIGDVVCLVSGANVPYVFRPVPDKEHTYTLVGEAYVHGIMKSGSEIGQGLEIIRAKII